MLTRVHNTNEEIQFFFFHKMNIIFIYIFRDEVTMLIVDAYTRAKKSVLLQKKKYSVSENTLPLQLVVTLFSPIVNTA